MPRPTVWIVKEQVRRGDAGTAPMDYTPAYAFGDIKFITEFDPPIYPGSNLLRNWEDQVRNFVKEYDPSNDYIILTGAPLAIFLIGAIVGQIKSSHPVKILVWRREQNAYVPAHFPI